MADLDLSRAYAAAACGVASDYGRVNTVDRDRVVGSMCVDLALPFILEALHARAVEEMDTAEPFSVEMDDIDAVVRWLRAKAEEARAR